MEPMVVVVDDGADALLDEAIRLAGLNRCVLHLVATHRTPRPRSFGVPERTMRRGAIERERAEARLAAAAERADASGVATVPHALAMRSSRAVAHVASATGAVHVAARPTRIVSLRRRVARILVAGAMAVFAAATLPAVASPRSGQAETPSVEPCPDQTTVPRPEAPSPQPDAPSPQQDVSKLV